MVPARALILLTLLCLSVPQAQAIHILTPDVDLDCSRAESMLACSYRLLATSSTATIVASSAKHTLNVTTSKLYPAADSITSVLFLVDTSDPGRQNVISRNADQIAKIFTKAAPHQRFGLASFNKDMIVNVPVGGATETIISVAHTLAATGMTTELYRSTLRAIEMIGHVHADRKVIYLMSDGQAEDKAYFHEDVIRAAQKYGVVINSLGYPRSIPLSVALQTLRRLSEETGGIYIETGMDFGLPGTFMESPFANIDRGGQFIIDLGPLLSAPSETPVVTVRFETATANLDVPIPLQLDPPSVVPATLPATPPITIMPTVVDTAPPAIPSKRDLLDTVLWYGVPVALVLLSVMTLCTLILLYRKQTVRTLTAVIPMERPLAYLIRQDESAKTFPITSATCRIGRSRDNEMIIDDSSVSRRHAEIRRTFDGQFVLYDRESTNGVYVNDRKISRHKLAEGDILEIGDIYLCFTRKTTQL